MGKKVIRKIIYKAKTRRKFFIKSIERKIDFIEAIIHIHNRNFDFAALNVYHIVHRKIMGYYFL